MHGQIRQHKQTLPHDLIQRVQQTSCPAKDNEADAVTTAVTGQNPDALYIFADGPCAASSSWNRCRSSSVDATSELDEPEARARHNAPEQHTSFLQSLRGANPTSGCPVASLPKRLYRR